MMSLFETVARYLLKSVVRFVCAGLLVCGMDHSAIAASAQVSFGGFVMPRAAATSVAYSQTLVSFTDQVLLPVPANAGGATGLSVYSGAARVPVEFQLVDLPINGGSQAVLVALTNNAEQLFYLCQDGSAGCVLFTVIRSS